MSPNVDAFKNYSIITKPGNYTDLILPFKSSDLSSLYNQISLRSPMDSFFFFLQGEIHNKMEIQAKVFQTDILFSSREWIRSPFTYERKSSFLHPLQDIMPYFNYF